MTNPKIRIQRNGTGLATSSPAVRHRFWQTTLNIVAGCEHEFSANVLSSIADQHEFIGRPYMYANGNPFGAFLIIGVARSDLAPVRVWVPLRKDAPDLIASLLTKHPLFFGLVKSPHRAASLRSYLAKFLTEELPGNMRYWWHWHGFYLRYG